MGKIVCFGEVLWDKLPTGKKVGGAPLNVAIRLKSLGNDAYVISSIGDDNQGTELIKEIKPYNINIDYIQVNNKFATSEVLVDLNNSSSAEYDILYPRAWDGIEFDPKTKELVKNADAFIFGSLVARNEDSRNTLLKYLEHASYKVFDVNLRPPHYTHKLIQELMHKVDFIKFNDQELFEVCEALGHDSKDLEDNISFISAETNTKSICVTLGDKGAVLFVENTFYYNCGYKIKVADTVGSGDSFLASLLSQLLRKTPPQTAINFACAVGAMVAQCEGANPIISREEINNFMLKN